MKSKRAIMKKKKDAIKRPVEKIVRRISGNHRHFQYCCIFVGLNCCCGKGTKWERKWGRLTEREVETRFSS